MKFDDASGAGPGGTGGPGAPRLAVITCAVLEAEIEHFAANLPHVIHIENMEQGLHNEPRRLTERVQAAIDHVELSTDAEAIALGYGLCSRGVEGLTTRRARLVITRAHDCITLLLGSRQRYAEYVAEHPGTYWYSPGWNKHHLPPGPQRYDALRREYLAKYGEDNADYLMQTEQSWFENYDRATYVDLTIGATDADVQYTQACADWLGWQFDHQHGDADLLRSLLEGRWDDDRFLVIEPGQTFTASGDDRIVRAIDAPTPKADAP
ncbi:DUF1638 domain-containing protein [Planctomycetales bacterium ZRK34]|nr:DUF1638 domain-containing protein [Planctomycetales bacterium ZRK34]